MNYIDRNDLDDIELKPFKYYGGQIDGLELSVLFTNKHNPTNIKYTVNCVKSPEPSYTTYAINARFPDNIDGVYIGFMVGNTFYYINNTRFIIMILSLHMKNSGTVVPTMNSHWNHYPIVLNVSDDSTTVEYDTHCSELIDIEFGMKYIRNFNIFQFLKNENMIAIIRENESCS